MIFDITSPWVFFNLFSDAAKKETFASLLSLVLLEIPTLFYRNSDYLPIV